MGARPKIADLQGDNMRYLLRFAVAVAAGVLATSVVHSQPADWPNRPIRIIVPAPAGGPYDQVIRPVAQNMSQSLKEIGRAHV